MIMKTTNPNDIVTEDLAIPKSSKAISSAHHDDDDDDNVLQDTYIVGICFVSPCGGQQGHPAFGLKQQK